MGASGHDSTLGDFLKSRRARVSPEDTGTPPVPGRRRVPGLRREELARLAGVSVEYYTRLEQGRSRNASPMVLDAIARALRLDDTERSHLWNLSGTLPGKARHGPPQRVLRETWHLLARLERGEVPALVLGRRMDLLALNKPARALFQGIDLMAVPAGERNMARIMFCDPRVREIYPEWEDVAAEITGTLQFYLGRHPDDPLMHELVCDLRKASPVFRRLWAEHQVTERVMGEKRYRHPVIGELTVTYQAMALPGVPDQTLLVFTVEPGSASEDALHRVVAWYEEQQQGQRV
ncbi:helix-turn-helix transcriptional regulator [Sphaerisporangium aureirubrum]|uniref:Helix-turn-helix transcriptional regulator n=1 Tax=Sphaerisporangium aureirubrum TaxID=1544736 RepID=A0ABW1NLT8_9ACTN